MTFLDHGGLIVAAHDYHQRSSGTLKYSTDEGLHWNDFNFSPGVAIVLGVVTDPDEATTDVWSVYFWTSKSLKFALLKACLA